MCITAADGKIVLTAIWTTRHAAIVTIIQLKGIRDSGGKALLVDELICSFFCSGINHLVVIVVIYTNIRFITVVEFILGFI